MRLGTCYRTSLLRQLGLDSADGRVLDIGGFDGEWASSLGAAEAYVVDLEVEAQHPHIGYVVGDGARLPFPDGTFDSVFAIEVMEHVPEERALIEEMFRVLRPGGRLLLTTPSSSIRVFPPFMQGWVNRRWQHERVPGVSADYVEELLAPFARELRVRRLACRALRASYLPLSVLWRATPSLSSTLVGAVAAWDSAHAEGDHGYILAEGVAR